MTSIRKYFIYSISALALLISSSCSDPDPCGHIDNKDTEKALACLAAQPKENITDDLQVLEFLKKHKVYISLTTSPKRIKNLLPTLRSLDLEHVSGILVSIPERFGRDNSTYDIPDFLDENSPQKYEKIQLIRPQQDLGPATKLIPAVEYLVFGKGLKDGVVVTVDDDIGYPRGGISQVIKSAILNGGAVSSQTNPIEAFNVPRSKWPAHWIRKAHRRSHGVRPADIVEGWGAVAYRLNIFDDSLLKTLKKNIFASKQCFFSDDITVSYTLAQRNIPRWNVRNQFTAHVFPFAFGNEEDALHKGAGVSSQPSGMGGNAGKYRECIDMLNALK